MVAMRPLARRRPRWRSCAGRRRSPRCRDSRAATPSSTCWPAATPATRSPSCGRGSSGTASPARSPPAPGAQRLAVTSGGTIPDRGLFGVFLVGAEGTARRVGELDEEMVYESRVGDVFLLGSSSWRIEDITHDRVLVTPAPGPARARCRSGTATPSAGPLELGRALGAFLREVGRPRPPRPARARARGRRPRRLGRGQPARLPRRAARRPPATSPTTARSSSSGSATSSATGGWSCTRPFGAQVHAPWALALAARLRERYGVDVAGDALRRRHRAAAARHRRRRRRRRDLAVLDPDDVERARHRRGRRLGAVRQPVPRVRRPRAAAAPPRPGPPHPAVAAAAARGAAARRWPASTPRSRSSSRRCARCLQDVFDVPGLVELMRDVRSARGSASSRSRPPAPSPFARVAAVRLRRRSSSTRATRRWPSAGRRRSRSTRRCSPSCSAAPSCASCSTPTRSPRSRPSCSGCPTTGSARDVEGAADLLRVLGDLIDGRGARAGRRRRAWLAELEAPRRAIRVRIAGEERWVADRGRRPAARRARHRRCRSACPRRSLEPVADPLGDLVAPLRPHARPVPAGRRRRPVRARRRGRHRRPAAAGRHRPGGRRASSGPAAAGTEWCDAEVLRLAAPPLAGDAAPGGRAGPARRAGPLPAGLAGRRRPALRGRRRRAARRRAARRARSSRRRALESLVLPGPGARLLPRAARRADQRRRGAVGRRRRAARRRRLGRPRTRPTPRRCCCPSRRRRGARHAAARAVLDALAAAARCSSAALSDLVGSPPTTRALADALWDLVWAGRLTNDTLRRCAPGSGRRRHAPRRAPHAPGATLRLRPLPAGRPAMPARTGPPTVAGRWSRCPSARPTRPGAPHARAEALLDRHGVADPRRGHGRAGPRRLRRRLPGAARRSRRPAGPAAATSSRAWARRSSPRPASVDRLRTVRRPSAASLRRAVVLAADRPGQRLRRRAALARRSAGRGGHPATSRAARPGALVVLVDGELVLYVERGGKTLLSWTEDVAHAPARRRRAGPRGPRRSARQARGRARRRHRGARLPARSGSGTGRLPSHSARPAAARVSPYCRSGRRVRWRSRWAMAG